MQLFELINEFSKVAGYKTNIQKSVAFLYANHKISEKDIKQANISQPVRSGQTFSM